MNTADFNKDIKLPIAQGIYTKLSKKGEKIKFMIAATPHYETVHFLGDREVVLCGKYNSENPEEGYCKYCDDYQTAVNMGDKNTVKQIKPVTNFYYPILNLDTNQATIFQFTAKSIHYGIKGYSDEGVDVFACAWLVERTEDKKLGYYKILNMGPVKLTIEQEEQLKIAKGLSPKGRESSSVVDDGDGQPESSEPDGDDEFKPLEV